MLINNERENSLNDDADNGNEIAEAIDALIDGIPDFDPREGLIPDEFDREGRIDLVNKFYRMKHRKEPYIKNDPDDFKEMFKMLVATYMDYSYYFDVVDEVLSDQLSILKATDPQSYSAVVTGEADEQGDAPNPANDSVEYLFGVHGSLMNLVNTAKYQLRDALRFLFEYPVKNLQNKVLGRTYDVPIIKLEFIVMSLTDTIYELERHHNMEANMDTYVEYINSNMDALLKSKFERYELRNRFPKNNESESAIPARTAPYDLTKLPDIKELFELESGKYISYLNHYCLIDDIFEYYDETLEHSDASTYAGIYVFNNDDSSAAAETIADMRLALESLENLVDNRETYLRKLIKGLLKNKNMQTGVLGSAYKIPTTAMEPLLDAIFDTVTDIERVFDLKQNSNSFMIYLKEKLKAYAI